MDASLMDQEKNTGFVTRDEWNKLNTRLQTEKAIIDTRIDRLEIEIDKISNIMSDVKEISIRLDERQRAFDKRLELMQDENRLQMKQINDNLRVLSSTFSNIADVLVELKSKKD